MPDTLGYRKRIGIVVPSTNTTVQPETDLLRVPGVTCHTGRVTIKERPLNTEEALQEHMQMMRDGMGTAIDQIMTAGLDHLIMGIALESFWGGVVAAAKLQADLAQRAGVGISMGSTAALAALGKFGARKIAILTPHQPRGDEMVRAYFAEAAFVQGIFRKDAPLARAWLEDARKVKGTLPREDWDCAALAGISCAEGDAAQTCAHLTRAIAMLDRQPGTSGSVAACRERLAALRAEVT